MVTRHDSNQLVNYINATLLCCTLETNNNVCKLYSNKNKKAIICKKKKKERENENICLEFTCPSRFLCIALKYEIKK